MAGGERIEEDDQDVWMRRVLLLGKGFLPLVSPPNCQEGQQGCEFEKFSPA
jgi:hypothetical protein